jgi:hypothetical protein
VPNFQFDLDPSQIVNPLTITEIVSNKSMAANLRQLTKHKLFREPEVQKFFIPVDCSYWDLQLITEVAPGTIIPEHEHDEPVLRHILEGSMELNGVEYAKGDWIVVPANFRYSIQTRPGYKVLSGYHANCAECSWATLSKMPLGHIPG